MDILTLVVIGRNCLPCKMTDLSGCICYWILWKAITFLCGHSLLHDVDSPLCDVVSSLRGVVSPLRTVVLPLCDVVSPLRGVVLSLCDVVSS